jgi:hypothetical protein
MIVKSIVKRLPKIKKVQKLLVLGVAGGGGV